MKVGWELRFEPGDCLFGLVCVSSVEDDVVGARFSEEFGCLESYTRAGACYQNGFSCHIWII